MIRKVHVSVFVFLSFAFTLKQTEKSLHIPVNGVQKIDLVLKDEFSDREIEAFPLEADKTDALISDINAMAHAPTLKMMYACYKFKIQYTDGSVIELPTNGKGIGPTASGNFMATENLILKHWKSITREKLCKPSKPGTAGGSFGF